jgi:hypothetical protein
VAVAEKAGSCSKASEPEPSDNISET